MGPNIALKSPPKRVLEAILRPRPPEKHFFPTGGVPPPPPETDFGDFLKKNRCPKTASKKKSEDKNKKKKKKKNIHQDGLLRIFSSRDSFKEATSLGGLGEAHLDK